MKYKKKQASVLIQPFDTKPLRPVDLRVETMEATGRMIKLVNS